MRETARRWKSYMAWLASEGGATAVEYALMLALIAMVIVAAVEMLGRSTSNAFNSMTFTP